MKIGILTLPLHTNYGGILQAYALQAVLERMGHEVVVIDRNTCIIPSIKKKIIIYSKRFVKKYFLRKDIRIFTERYNSIINPKIRRNTDSFIRNNIHRIIIDRYPDVLKLYKFDVIVVGSDQVWRPKYFGDDIRNAYLGFINDKVLKKIAYAVSFGVDNWEYNYRQTIQCKHLIKKFDAVSVRESSGIDFCRRYFNYSAEWVVDPTLLLSKFDYQQLLDLETFSEKKGRLFCYLLDASKEKVDYLQIVASQLQLSLNYMKTVTEKSDNQTEVRIQPPVEEWLGNFYEADFVVTDSFHACVFSIIFKKQFVVIANKERGNSRFESLLGKLGLESRIVDSSINVSKLTQIDYSKVYQIIDIWKDESLDFIRKALK